MKNSIYDLLLNCLKFTISKDETRSYLQGVYHDKEAQKAVSTNGYALTATRMFYDEDLAGKIIGNDFTTIKRDFVSWKVIVPQTFLHEQVFKVEKHHYVKTKKPTQIFLTSEGLRFEPLTDNDLCINAEYLKPLVGLTLKFCWNSPAAPIKVILREDQDDYYIIQPMKRY